MIRDGLMPGVMRQRLGQVGRTALRGLRFARWVASRPTAYQADRRVLAIYDLTSQPFNIGDVLLMQAASLALAEEHRIATVDFAVVYDAQRPACADPAFASIDQDNLLFHLSAVLPVAQVNPRLGSVFVFDSHARCERFLLDADDGYLVWPSAWRYASRDYIFYLAFNEVIHDFWSRHGRIPRLACRPYLRSWAHGFYAEHAAPDVPISVQLRKNRVVGPHRNVQIDCWLQFFEHCATQYPARFVVIGSRTEIDARLHGLPNVCVAKDSHTAIEEDLAIVQTAAFHMGAASGPGMVALFGNKPFLMVNADMKPDSCPDLVQEDRFLRYVYSSPAQRFDTGAETTDLLISEFVRMWSAVKPSDWATPGIPQEDPALQLR